MSDDPLEGAQIKVASTDTHPVILLIDEDGHADLTSRLALPDLENVLQQLLDSVQRARAAQDDDLRAMQNQDAPLALEGLRRTVLDHWKGKGRG